MSTPVTGAPVSSLDVIVVVPVMELPQVRVFDGGADGLAATPGNTLFAVQGVFVP